MVKPVFNRERLKKASQAFAKDIQPRNQYVTLSDYQKRQLLKDQELRKKDKTTKNIKGVIKDIKTTKNKKEIKNLIKDIENVFINKYG